MGSRIDITDRNNLIVNTEVDFSDYVFEVDTFNVANPFDLTLSNLSDVEPRDVEQWYGVNFYVDEKIVFKGVIQRLSQTGEKGRIEVKLSGKNRASILVESFCTNYKDFRNQTPIDIIDKLVQQTNFYPQPVSNAQTAASVLGWDEPNDTLEFNTAIENGIRDNKAFIGAGDVTLPSQDFQALPTKSHYKIEPGDKVFDKINSLVRSVGYDVVYQTDGTLFFGDISKKRLNESPLIRHRLYLEEDGNATNNVLSWDISKDTSGLYSEVTVISQTQNGTNNSKTATDSTVLDKKSQVVQINNDTSSPEKEAIRIREDNRIASFNARYTVSDHVDGVGQPFMSNRTVLVNDTVNNVVGEFVLYNVTYSFSRQEGFTTDLNLSYARRKGLDV